MVNENLFKNICDCFQKPFLRLLFFTIEYDFNYRINYLGDFL